MKRKIAIFLAVALTWASTAFALKFEYETVYGNNPEPGGPTPWLVAEFTQTTAQQAANQVILTLSAGNLTTTEFVSKWFFNVESYTSLTFSPIVLTGTQLKNAPSYAIDAQNAPNNLFDLMFEFKTSNADRFGNTDIAKITINGAGITPDFFDTVTPGENGLSTIAHIQGLPNDGSTWVTTGGGDIIVIEIVPEPGTLVLLGLGLAGLGIYRRKQK